MKNNKKLFWHTEKRKIRDLIPFDKNPRILSDFQKEKLKESLIKFNLVDIPILDKNNVIISGNQRVKVLILLGRSEEEIDVRVPNRKLSKAEIKEYNLKGNLHNGEWDFEALKGFEIETLMDAGFSEADLSKIWDSNLETEEDNFQVEEELAKIKEPKTKLGDVVKLGSHVLVCGDSLDPKVIEKLSKEKIVDMIYVDPPYNISLDYNKGIGGKGSYGGQTNDNKSETEYIEFLRKILKNGLTITKENANCFIWNDERNIGLVQSLFKELGIENKRVCVWVKNGFNPTPNIAFNKCFEACIYGTIGKPYLSDSLKNLNEIMNKEIGSGNRTIDDILDLLNIWLVKRLSSEEYSHPTQKPPTLHEKAIRRCTKVGDTILDLCAGSGSLMVSCEQLKRKCLMAEIEPIFCDLIVSRYKQLTGKEVEYVN